MSKQSISLESDHELRSTESKLSQHSARKALYAPCLIDQSEAQRVTGLRRVDPAGCLRIAEWKDWQGVVRQSACR
jgi:hypothetical protein